DMSAHQQQVAALILKNPDVAAFMSSLGGGGGGGAGNQGRVVMRLKPRPERPDHKSADEIIRQLQPRLNTIPGIRVYLQNPPPVRIGGRFSKALYQYTLQSPDIDELYHGATALETKLRGTPELENVTSDLLIKNPQVNVQ